MLRSFLLFFAMAAAMLAADASGTWKGTLVPEDGNEGPALVILQQKGDAITGTGGQDENDRHEISNGKVAGEKVTFEIAVRNGVMKFDLKLDGNSLSGDITRERDGQVQKAKLNLKREP